MNRKCQCGSRIFDDAPLCYECKTDAIMKTRSWKRASVMPRWWLQQEAEREEMMKRVMEKAKKELDKE